MQTNQELDNTELSMEDLELVSGGVSSKIRYMKRHMFVHKHIAKPRGNRKGKRPVVRHRAGSCPN